MRVELLEGRFYLTASAYDITQTGQNHSVAGVATAMNGIWTDPVLNTLNPTYASRALTGGTNESQTLHATGYEVEVQANLTPAWTLTAGYGNNINRVGEQDVSTLRYVNANLPEWERLAASHAASAPPSPRRSPPSTISFATPRPVSCADARTGIRSISSRVTRFAPDVSVASRWAAA